MKQKLVFAVLLVAASIAPAQNSLPPGISSQIDDAANKALTDYGVPSASVAIVRDGKLAYAHAYGMARLEPPTPATPAMRYSIGSISKQFTAAAVLLLKQQGKLSLDDKVGKYLPDLTRANEVTIRMLLSHTSGYQDYWPEDYVMPPMLGPATSNYIMDTWAKKPLDFDPGTKWQYSNTNYVIAGRIVEMVSGIPLFRFLEINVFTPLHMDSVYNTDIARLGDTDAQGYLRYALGPPRPAPKEGPGWMFAAGELAMPASDLAKWNISLIDKSLLAPASYQQMFDPVKLKDGTDTHYGLGIETRQIAGHSALEHSGEVSGFVSENIVFPAERAAVTVLTNEDASPAAGHLGDQISSILLNGAQTDAAASAAEAQAEKIFTGLQQGQIDRMLFTSNCSAYFSQQALDDFESSLKPLGAPVSFKQTRQELRGGMVFRAFRVKFSGTEKSVMVTTYTMPDGKLEQYLVAAIY